MSGWITPARRRGIEALDDSGTPDDVREAAMRDVARANALFGGTRAVVQALQPVLPSLPRRAVLLDVGTGMADLAQRAWQLAETRGVALTSVGMDISESLLRVVRHRLSSAVVGDALRLPFADDSADVVLCSQVLHHFAEADARRLIAELHRVSRRWVVVSDLRRSWFAAGGFFTAAKLLRFHPVTTVDGVVSVLRGFTTTELRRLVADATGTAPHIKRGVFWRVTAVWSKPAARRLA